MNAINHGGITLIFDETGKAAADDDDDDDDNNKRISEYE